MMNGRGGEIRTPDLLVPNQALYQAKLRPDGRGSRGTNIQSLSMTGMGFAEIRFWAAFQPTVPSHNPLPVDLKSGVNWASD
jgi:hypothetical protein